MIAGCLPRPLGDERIVDIVRFHAAPERLTGRRLRRAALRMKRSDASMEPRKANNIAVRKMFQRGDAGPGVRDPQVSFLSAVEGLAAVQKNLGSATRESAAGKNRLEAIKDSWGWDGRSFHRSPVRPGSLTGQSAILGGFVSIVGVPEASQRSHLKVAQDIAYPSMPERANDDGAPAGDETSNSSRGEDRNSGRASARRENCDSAGWSAAATTSASGPAVKRQATAAVMSAWSGRDLKTQLSPLPSSRSRRPYAARSCPRTRSIQG